MIEKKTYQTPCSTLAELTNEMIMYKTSIEYGGETETPLTPGAKHFFYKDDWDSTDDWEDGEEDETPMLYKYNLWE